MCDATLSTGNTVTANTHTQFESSPLHSINSALPTPSPASTPTPSQVQPSQQRSQDPPDMSSRPNGNRCTPPSHHKKPTRPLSIPPILTPLLRPNISTCFLRSHQKSSHPMPSHSPVLACSRVEFHFIPSFHRINRHCPALLCPSADQSTTFSHLPSEATRQDSCVKGGEVGGKRANRAVSTLRCAAPTQTPVPAGTASKKKASDSAGGHTLIFHPQKPSHHQPPSPTSPPASPPPQKGTTKRSVAR